MTAKELNRDQLHELKAKCEFDCWDDDNDNKDDVNAYWEDDKE